MASSMVAFGGIAWRASIMRSRVNGSCMGQL
jgi:hypothetical protein